MSLEDPLSYFRRRAREERWRAATSEAPAASAAHYALAELHEDRADRELRQKLRVVL